MNTKDCIKKAIEVQELEGIYSDNVLYLYQKAIEVSDTNSGDDYDFLYAHYQIMLISEMTNKIEQGLEYAEKCLDLVKPYINATASWYFTEQGQFNQEVIRRASNTIAWHKHLQTDNLAELEELSDLIDRGIEYVNGMEYFYIFDTKVRILLKMGNKDEAFKIVYNCLKKDGGFRDFEDIKSSPEYVLWKNNFESGILFEYNLEERDFLEKAERLIQKIQQSINAGLFVKDFEEFVPQKEIITIAQARQKYNIKMYDSDNEKVLVFKGNTKIKGNADENWLESQLEGMEDGEYILTVIFDGNLLVAGDIADGSTYRIYVLGDVVADCIYSQDGIIDIQGGVDVQFGIYGEYNDGFFHVRRFLNTPFIISYDHDMPTEASGEYVYIEAGNGYDIDNIKIANGDAGMCRDFFKEPNKFISNKVLSDNGLFDVSNFFEMLKKGESPFMKIKV